jgi:KUP system potassium uptake protein
MAEDRQPQRSASPARAGRLVVLSFGALGVVYGDIGTSPLYAIHETFAGPHPLPIDRPHVLGVLSLVFWTLIVVVSVKYLTVIMRADNDGEGGSLALLALAERAVAGRKRLIACLGVVGIVAAALFYGDSMITPAISVLSAVEGLKVAAPSLEPFVVPLTVAILVGLFALQRHGTGAIGFLFGPIMLIWFAVLGVLGVRSILNAPDVLFALSPHYAAAFLIHDGRVGFLALGSVFLVATGSEALYADMGHFGRNPIRIAWYGLVLPALVLNYFGQGALLLANPEAIDNPFIRIAPGWAFLPMVILSTLATIIASQAVISGAFSMTQQAMQLGYVPRVRMLHTSETTRGQIYIPFVNWSLLVFIVVLVVGFGSSTNLASAYGLAVSGTMVLSTVQIAVLIFLVWRWRWLGVALIALFAIVDLTFFSANATKIPHGGWFPLVVAVIVYVLLTTWKRGRQVLRARQRRSISIEELMGSLSDKVARVPGTAMFLTGHPDEVPGALLHNLKHNKVLHERNVFLTVSVLGIPHVPGSRRIESRDAGHGFRCVELHYGYLDPIDVPKALAAVSEEELGFKFEPLEVSYFLTRETLVRSPEPLMKGWRAHLFFWMSRSSLGTLDFFQLPTNRVVELGTQVAL